PDERKCLIFMKFLGTFMAIQRNRVKRNQLSAALAAVLVFSTPAVLAQEQDETTPETEQTDRSATQLDKIVVTGSRIQRDTFNSPSPVQVINREESTVAGFNSTAGILQSNAVTGGSEQIN